MSELVYGNNFLKSLHRQQLLGLNESHECNYEATIRNIIENKSSVLGLKAVRL